MGVSLYQRFDIHEAALFLRCSVVDIQEIADEGGMEHIRVTKTQIEFFGYQLVKYLMQSVSGSMPASCQAEERGVVQAQSERILRSREVQEMTGLSRTTIWRLETRGDFPSRVALTPSSVGWRLREVEAWLESR